MGFRFLHAADIHLDSPLRGLGRYEGAPVEEIRNATRRAFVNLVDLAIDERVAFVLLAGDIYDGDWRDYNTGLFFVEQAARLGREGIRVYLISGNHDAASQISRTLRYPDNVHVFPVDRPDTVRLEALGVLIHGQGFAARVVSDNLATGYPQGETGWLNIGMLHTSLDGRPGHEPYAPCTVDDLRSRGYQYWALGHVHQREVISQRPWIVFPGNPQGRHIRETGARGCTLVTVTGGDIVEVAHSDLDVLRWSCGRVDVSGAGTPEDVLDRTGPVIEREFDQGGGRILALRLEIVGACDAHGALHAAPDRWRQQIRAQSLSFGSLWVERIRFDTRPSGAENQAPEGPLAALLGDLDELVPDEEDLVRYASEFAELRRKLPPDLFAGEDVPDPATAQAVKALLDDARALLADRLLSRGTGE
ncbi:MAG: DNA repair exonuclease [Pseudomonadota bacterium]|nr:DNA repair exonuclease [Pseudomonadota bacterium]